MPIYEYECPECNTTKEEICSGKQDHSNRVVFCNKCKKNIEMKKIISLSTFVLEGRGWGKDGYVNTFEQVKDLV